MYVSNVYVCIYMYVREAFTVHLKRGHSSLIIPHCVSKRGLCLSMFDPQSEDATGNDRTDYERIILKAIFEGIVFHFNMLI